MLAATMPSLEQGLPCGRRWTSRDLRHDRSIVIVRFAARSSTAAVRAEVRSPIAAARLAVRSSIAPARLAVRSSIAPVSVSLVLSRTVVTRKAASSPSSRSCEMLSLSVSGQPAAWRHPPAFGDTADSVADAGFESGKARFDARTGFSKTAGHAVYRLIEVHGESSRPSARFRLPHPGSGRRSGRRLHAGALRATWALPSIVWRMEAS